MKANFNIKKIDSPKQNSPKSDSKDLTPEEFEDFIVKSGSKGSFMVYRSAKKEDELGLDSL